MQLETIWALTNLASETTEYCYILVNVGVIPLSVQLLRFETVTIIEQAIWLVGQLAADLPFFRDSLIDEGAVEIITSIIKDQSDTWLITYTCWALSNLCRGTPLPASRKVLPAIDYLCQVISCGIITDRDIISDCCWSICWHTDQPHQAYVL